MVRRKSTSIYKSPQSSDESSVKSNTNVLVPRNRNKRNNYRTLQEIKYLQRTVHFLIPKLNFARLVREIMYNVSTGIIERIQVSALAALQEAMEAYMVQFFEDCTLLTFHGKRKTLMRADMILVRRLRGRQDVINK